MKLEIPKEFKEVVEENQLNLKKAIIFHQRIYHQLLQDVKNEELRRSLQEAEKVIVKYGMEQKIILQKVRAEISNQAKQSQKNSTKFVIEEKKQQLSTNLVRSRKQKIAPKISPKASCSDDSNEDSAKSPSPKLQKFETPELLEQIEFLKLFSLTTLENCKEMRNRRAERKRRSTAIRDFIYETDLPAKRKKNGPTSISPPNTRQAVKKKNGRRSPQTEKTEEKKLTKRTSSESIPEMISDNSTEIPMDELSNSVCNSCKSDGAIIQCELCMESFHENCEEPSFLGTTKRCPNCTKKKTKKKPGILEQTAVVKSSG